MHSRQYPLQIVSKTSREHLKTPTQPELWKFGLSKKICSRRVRCMCILKNVTFWRIFALCVKGDRYYPSDCKTAA